MNRNRAIAQQGAQPERRATRHVPSTSLAAAGLALTLGVQPQNRNEPQLNPALNTFSPSDALSALVRE